jgi:AcrR family transcriptional regulator
MALQARAEATRRKILDSAVELFSELGYGETGLSDVLQRAGVSKGAFYYHFDSKESVATAIIEEFSERLKKSARELFDASNPQIEGVIRATFDSAALIARDDTARVGHELLQALSQISSVAAAVYESWTKDFVAVIARAIEPWTEKDDRIDAAEAAEAIWVGILGCHLLSSALGDDHLARLARSWKPALQMLMPADQADAYVAMVDEIAASYAATV